MSTYTLRPYQQTCVSQVIAKWAEHKRLLAVLPTGAGKTIIFANIASRVRQQGKVLILAHREELLQQAITKIRLATGVNAQLERAEERADRSADVVVASIQTMMRRHDTFAPDHFKFIIIDEAHHVAADSYQKILGYFFGAKQLGVTATPDRADQRELGHFFDDLAFEVTLQDLIRERYLSKIRVRVCDVKIDLTNVRINTGDFDANESAGALEPMLASIAQQITLYGGKKVLVFLPLIATSQRMRDILVRHGMNAMHVDGQSPDRKEILEWFANQKEAVLCNAMLLTEGYDEPSIDTIVCLRPTRSRALYTQMVGRGTRLAPGKEQLLILDFLWMTGRHRLVRPTSLISQGEVEEIADKATTTQAEFDLEEAVHAAIAEREAKLAAELARKKKTSLKVIDPVEYGLFMHEQAITDYEPTMEWHSLPPTEKQIEILTRMKFDVSSIRDRGHASALLDSTMARTKRRLATAPQVKLLRRMGHHNAFRYSFDQASKIISERCKRQ